MSHKTRTSSSQPSEPQPDKLGLSAGEILRFASAMIVTSGASYLLGYIGQIDTSLFSYLGGVEFVNAAIVYLPVALILGAINVFTVFFRSDQTLVPLMQPLRKNDDGEWSKSTLWLYRLGAIAAIIGFASILGLPLRANMDLSPSLGIFTTLAVMFIANEIYQYGKARYGWLIRNYLMLISAFYFLVTSIFIGALHASMHENAMHYRGIIQLENGANICVTTHKRLGGRLLLFDVERSEWRTVKSSDVRETLSLTATEFVLRKSCDDVVDDANQRKIRSFVLQNEISAEELDAYREAHDHDGYPKKQDAE